MLSLIGPGKNFYFILSAAGNDTIWFQGDSDSFVENGVVRARVEAGAIGRFWP